MAQVDLELARRASRPRFADCMARYLMQSQALRRLEAIRVHVRLLDPHSGTWNHGRRTTPRWRRSSPRASPPARAPRRSIAAGGGAHDPASSRTLVSRR